MTLFTFGVFTGVAGCLLIYIIEVALNPPADKDDPDDTDPDQNLKP